MKKKVVEVQRNRSSKRRLLYKLLDDAAAKIWDAYGTTVGVPLHEGKTLQLTPPHEEPGEEDDRCGDGPTLLFYETKDGETVTYTTEDASDRDLVLAVGALPEMWAAAKADSIDESVIDLALEKADAFVRGELLT